MFKEIVSELKHHIPFTAVGAITGIIIMAIIVFTNVLPQVSQISYPIFYILHPAHVVLSAVATTALYRKYSNSKTWAVILVGFAGSIGIATLSDSIVPYLGETLLGLENRGIHIGFIEEWLIVNLAALAGVIIGFWLPATRLPHSGHVLISTWASLFHIIMALGETVTWVLFLVIFFFLFLAVWIPVCLSDIIFPLLFTGKQLSPPEDITYNQ